MAVTASDILKLFAVAVPKEILAKMDPAKPMLAQGVDSLALTSLAVALEREYKIELTVPEAIKLQTVNDVAAFINGKKK